MIKIVRVFNSVSYSTEAGLTFFLNGKKIKNVKPGTTVFEGCKQNLPKNERPATLCHHPSVKPTGVCRVCLVEQGPVQKNLEVDNIRYEAGKKKWFVPSCTTKIHDGMNIWTNTEGVVSNVKDLLKMILATHPMECPTCPVNGKCEFQDLLERYDVKVSDLDKAQLERVQTQQVKSAKKKIHDKKDWLSKFEQFGSRAIRLDRDKCVKCTRCIRACEEIQNICVLGMEYRNQNNQVTCFAENESFALTDCIACGQCSYICPTGAISAQSNIKDVRDLLNGTTRTKTGEKYLVIAQTAPAVRVALSEGWNLEPGTLTDNQMVAALKDCGFKYVFDTNFSADLTIMEEGSELLERVKKGGPFPMFTSCCPAWINLVEKRYPEFIPNLSTCKSPQQMMGALVKHYYADKIGVPKENIKLVSFMPCTAKKEECAREQMKGDVDYVLTTREMIDLIKINKTKIVDIKGVEFDVPLGLSTGAAVIFGATGGVMEAAIRTVYELVMKKPLPKIDFEECRGLEGIKTAEIDLNGLKVRIAIAHTTGKAQELLQKIKEGKEKFHFVEVMSCKGGCVGGGGEPKVTWNDEDVLKRRSTSIYTRDEQNVIRKSHENEHVKQLYSEYLKAPLGHLSHKYLHTHYKNRKNNNNKH